MSRFVEDLFLELFGNSFFETIHTYSGDYMYFGPSMKIGMGIQVYNGQILTLLQDKKQTTINSFQAANSTNMVRSTTPNQWNAVTQSFYMACANPMAMLFSFFITVLIVILVAMDVLTLVPGALLAFTFSFLFTCGFIAWRKLYAFFMDYKGLLLALMVGGVIATITAVIGLLTGDGR